MRKFYIFALVATMFAACATDDTQDVQFADAPETLTVGFEGGDDNTRVQLNSAGKTVWTKGDLVSVFYRSDANQKWQFQGKTGERTGLLKRVSTPEATMQLSDVVVAYPYSEEYYINPKTCNIQAYLPATQSYLKDSFGLDGNLMVSASEYNQIYLKNVCGWLKLQLTGNGEMVQSITLKGNNGEQVAGSIYVDTETATATLAAETNGDYEDGVGGTLVFDDAILTEVTLNCGNGVTLGSSAKSFYIALPPQTFEKGLTIEVACSDGSTMTKSTDKSLAIERNCIQPMTSLAYEGVIPEVFELTYTTNDGEPLDPYTTDGFGANFVENIYDAATGNGLLKFDGKITTIPERAFVACGNLTHINLPVGITAIKAEAFSSCGKLAIMDIPQGVKTIGNKAFYNCGGVTEITIPSSVTSIGTSSFEGCGGKAYINCKIPGGASSSIGKFYKAKFTEITIGNGVTSIGSYAFEDCTSLTSVTILDSVTSIGNRAFQGCTSLTRVDITDLSAWCKISFYSIDANPLYNGAKGAKLYINNTEATDIIIPSDITEIKQYAFYGCKSLTSVTIPDSVTSIGDDAFRGCSSLTNVTIGKSVTSIGTYAFCGCTSLTSVNIPDSVTEIGDYAFYGCKSLTSVTIPDRVTSIRDYAFYNCTSLTSVTIPDSVTEIGDHAFENCTSLKRVDITDLSAWCKISFSYSYATPLYYGAKLYLNGSELTDIIIPSDITEIKNHAFDGCTSLTKVTIPDSVTSIGNYAFRNCTSLTSITIPDSVTSIVGGYAFDGCSSLTRVDITDLSAWCKISFYSSSNPLCNGAKLYINNTEATDIIIPSDITEIKQYAFYKCTSLISVTIPDSVTSIGRSAFHNCTSLTSITIPDSVTSIGEYAFRNCTSLTSVTIGKSVTSIGTYAFAYCTSLTSVNIPDSVTSIGNYAFQDCSSLTSVIIPDSVTSIGGRAFYNCTSLKEVYCKPTTPPTAGSGMFYINASGRKIYVPASADNSIINAYKAKQYWSDFASYIFEYNFSAGQ